METTFAQCLHNYESTMQLCIEDYIIIILYLLLCSNQKIITHRCDHKVIHVITKLFRGRGIDYISRELVTF